MDYKKEIEDDLRNSLVIAEDILCNRFPTFSEHWATDKINIIVEVGLEIFKELRKQGGLK